MINLLIWLLFCTYFLAGFGSWLTFYKHGFILGLNEKFNLSVFIFLLFFWPLHIYLEIDETIKLKKLKENLHIEILKIIKERKEKEIPK